MKRQLIIFSLLLFSIAISAQVSFISNDKEDMRALADSIIAYSKQRYTFKEEINEKEYSYEYSYVNDNNNDDRLYITVRVKWIGRNEDLEIKGIPEYAFSYVSGRFLDLYPFWKRYINLDENSELLLKNGHSLVFKDEKRFLFVRGGGGSIWGISVKDIIK